MRANANEIQSFGALLRRHRLAASLSHERLAEHARLGVNTIAALERGRTSVPRRRTVLLLAKALGLTVEERAALIGAATRTLAANEAHGSKASGVTLPPMLHNLPLQTTSFVGRRNDRVQLRRLLSQTRLLTLTGPGGVGKTRLAVEVAGELGACAHEGYAAGIWRVELAPLGDGALVPRALASTLGVQESPGRPLLESLVGWLQARSLLMILDNCEHLIAACAAVTDALLRACPALTILATSREALNVAGEIVWPVEPLGADSDGLQMFVDRARAASPAFQITPENVSAAVGICQRLDGLPLAIELAAARVNALAAEEIEQRLDQRFTLLTSGRRSGPARHQTLRALVDWSYDLLTVEEQVLFRQLSVFSGGWTLAAAEAVCEPRMDVLRLLPNLVDKSLVQVERRAGQSRYRLLATLRQYAAESLREAREERPARTRHLRWCERLARAGDQGLLGVQHRAWFQRLEAEVDSFRAALSWSLIEPGELDAGLRLAAALTRFWFIHGFASEGGEWLEALLARAPISPARVEALSASGFLLVRRGAPGAAHRLLDEAVALARELGDFCLLAKALNHLGELRVQEGDLIGARAPLEESLALSAQATADCSMYWPKYLIQHNLGELAEAEGDTVAASTFYELSLKLASAQQDGWRWVVLCRLGQLHIDGGELVTARDRLTQALVTARDWGKAGWGVPPVLAGLANLAMAEDRPGRALRLAGAAIGLRGQQQARLQPTHAARLEAVTALARAALGEAHAQNAWAEGRAMRLDEAVAYALGWITSEPVTGALGGLTLREKDVAGLVGLFATNRQIADRLVISERTAKRHVENILLKLGLQSRAQVAEWARERGLSSPTEQWAAREAEDGPPAHSQATRRC